MTADDREKTLDDEADAVEDVVDDVAADVDVSLAAAVASVDAAVDADELVADFEAVADVVHEEAAVVA